MGRLNRLKEHETMRLVSEGASLARFGDGEIMIMSGGDAKLQRCVFTLASELQSILWGETKCIVGVPHSRGPNRRYWRRFLSKRSTYFDLSIDYGSSFITRPDEAPWIDTPEYWAMVASLWDGRRVTLVSSKDSPSPATISSASKRLHRINCPSRDAYDKIDLIEERVLLHESDITILCCGPCGTVLADRLADEGVWAVGLGGIGSFMK